MGHDQTEYLWKYDPHEAKVHVAPGEADHPAEFPDHESFATHVTHPDRTQGYAFPIEGGYRITDDEGKKVEDPYIVKRIVAELRHHRPPKDLPSVRYHGDPRDFDPEHYGSA